MSRHLRAVITASLALGLAVGTAGCKDDDEDTGDTAETDTNYQGSRTVAPDEGWRPIRPQWVDRGVIND